MDTSLGSRFGPGVVGAETPEMAFRVTAGEASAAVVLILKGNDDFGAAGESLGVDGVGVGDDHIDGLGGDTASLVGVLEELVEIGVGIANRSEHDHPSSQGELRVGDRAVVIGIDRLFFKAEMLAKPVNRGGGVAVAEAGDDGCAWGLFRGGHGVFSERRREIENGINGNGDNGNRAAVSI